MAAHHAFTVATDIPVYFCNPGSPWQRGSNENSYWFVAAELNSRPCKTLGWETPAERLLKLLAV